MSLANPDQPTKLIDEDYEICSHGTGAKDPKLAGMSLIEQFNYSISLSHEQESSEEQHKEEEEEEEEEEFEVCEVCLKDKEHDTFDCPYLDFIPNLKEATIGHGYAIVCRECHVLGGHPDRGWEGRAVMKSCCICQMPGDHWYSECPKNPNPNRYAVPSGRKQLMRKVYIGT